jgi:glycosyltransferase involved in cell wall biosynthesis
MSNLSIKTPVVTVILPAYNAERYVSESIQSVLDQTYTCWELIIINDGSTDKTRDIISTFDDERIQVIEQENRGVSAARNEGLSSAKGKYITFLDADDVLPPNSLEVRASYLELNKNIDLVDGKIIVKDAGMKNTVRIYDPYYTGLLLPRLAALDRRVFFNVCYMFKKEILDDILFVENMTHAEDLLFYTELASKCPVQYGFISEFIYCYRSSQLSAMSDLNGLEAGYLLFLSKLKYITGISLWEKILLRVKITRIMVLSWWHNRSYKRSLLSLFLYFFS